MDAEDKPNTAQPESAQAAPAQEPHQVDPPPATPATAQQFQEVEERMTAFERSTVRWTRVAVGVSSLAAIFICLQWREMHTGSTDTHNLAVAAGNQATWTQNLATNMQTQADRTKDLADQMKALADNTQKVADQSARQANTAFKIAQTGQQQLEASQRPWLAVDLTVPNGIQSQANGVLVGFAVRVRNIGKSPAVNTRIRAVALNRQGFRIEDLIIEQESLCREAAKKGVLEETVFPDSTWTDNSGYIIFGDELDKSKSLTGGFRTDDLLIHVIGCVEYSSNFSGENHRTLFAYSLFNGTRQNMAFTRNGPPVPEVRIGVLKMECCNDAY